MKNAHKTSDENIDQRTGNTINANLMFEYFRCCVLVCFIQLKQLLKIHLPLDD